MTRSTHSTNGTSADELMKAAESVAENGRRRIIRIQGKRLAIVPAELQQPHGPTPSPSEAEPEPFTLDDPLWQVIGIALEAGPEAVARGKDTYLAEAYDPHHT